MLANQTKFISNSKITISLGKGSEKKQKKCGPGAHFGGGGGVAGLEKYLPFHNSIVIFGKLSLGGNLIVQLCIFSCKDKAMLG